MKGHVRLPVEDCSEEQARSLMAAIRETLEAEGLTTHSQSVGYRSGGDGKDHMNWTLTVHFSDGPATQAELAKERVAASRGELA